MRIASLVPSATELLFALGRGGDVVAVTHECDHPDEVARLPRLTRSLVPAGLDPAEIDAAVRERVGAGESLYGLDSERLAELDVDLIVTQQVCEVCAVSSDDVRAIAARLPSRPEVISLDPARLGEVLDDSVRLGEACGDAEGGRRLRDRLERRIEAVRAATRGRPQPRVAALEWLDPVYIAGHWVPEMIAAAGGIDALGTEPGARSKVLSWERVAAARPVVVVVMPCGLYAGEAEVEARRHLSELEALGAERTVAVDAASSFSRPGPRLADGVELLGHLLHPDSVGPPSAREWREVT